MTLAQFDRFRILAQATMLLCAAFAVGSSFTLWAQDEDPFGGGAKAKAGEAKKGAKKGGSDSRVLQRRAEHPLINELRDSKPKTLVDLTDALRITLDLDRDDEFRVYAKLWKALKKSPEDLAAIHKKYGSGLFFGMARRPQFQPEGAEIAGLVMDAASKLARDPLSLTQAVTRLSDTDETRRNLALREIRDAGSEGINAIFTAIAEQPRKDRREVLRDALIALKSEATPMLIAAMESPSAPVRCDAAIVLGRLKYADAAVALIGPAVGGETDPEALAAAQDAMLRITNEVPPPAGAETYLVKRLESYLKGELPATINEAGEVPLLRWNVKSKSVEPVTYAREDAPFTAAERIARSLLKFRGDQPATRNLCLLALLESEKRLNDPDAPLPAGPGSVSEIAEQAGEEALLNVLDQALQRDLPFAAVSACEILAKIGTEASIRRGPQRMTSLVEAAGHSNPRICAAGVNAVLTIGPKQSFPGSSLVVEGMRRLLAGNGTPRVLVGHPQVDESDRIGALCGELGFESESASSGAGVLRAAQAGGDFALVLLSDRLDRPTVLETVQGLRRDVRSAFLPVGIMQHDVNLSAAAERAKNNDTRTIVVTVPHSTQTLEFSIERISALLGKRAISTEVRLDYKKQVLAHIEKLLAERKSYPQYDLSRLEATVAASLSTPGVQMQAIGVLGLFGTPSSQSMLLDFVTLPGNPVPLRQEAGRRFAAAVKADGLQIAPKRLQSLYETFNATDESDKLQKKFLGAILDIVEAPRDERSAEGVKP